MRVYMIFAAIFFVLVGCSADNATSVDTTKVATPDSTKSFYVALNGSPTGNGRKDHPWDLATALNQPDSVQPGDTIWIHGGTYQGTFDSKLTGTVTSPIVLRESPNERAIIDGTFTMSGQYAYYWGFELTFSDPNRVSAQPGSGATDIPRAQVATRVSGSFNKLINLIVHDRADGLYAGKDAEGLEVYGSIFYNNGWVGPDRGHGHNLYLQNDAGTKRVTDNVLFNSFDAGLQIYGSDAAYLWNFDIEGNSIFGSADPVATQFGPTWNILQYGGGGHLGLSIYRNNSLFHRDGRSVGVIFGYPAAIPGEKIEFSKNIAQGQNFFYDMKEYLVTSNKFTSPSSVVGLQMPPGAPYSANTWTDNTYSAPALGNPFQIMGTATTRYQFPAWQAATGYDAAGSFTAGQFTGADIVLRPNQYEPGRAFITVWNWDGSSAVNVNLSSVLKTGDHFEIHHVFDLFGAPLVSGTYDGSPVSIPQQTLSPPAPIGYPASPAMPDNHFNVFLVEKR
jgi:hypothetical protein